MNPRPARKWSTSLLYGVSSLCALTAMMEAAVNEELTLDVTSFTFGTGVVLWTVAAIQEFYRAHTRRSIPTITEENPQQTPDTVAVTENTQWRNSTHARLNSALHIGASACLLISDRVALAKTSSTLVLSSRIAGSAFWLKGAALTHGGAHQQAREEKHPELGSELCGVKQSTVGLIVELDYLLAAILYAIATFSAEATRNNPLKVIGITCWMLAGLYDTLHAINNRCREGSNNESRVVLIDTSQAAGDNVSIQVNNESTRSPRRGLR